MEETIGGKILFFAAISILGVMIAFALFGRADAFNPFDIKYPIVELGNCADQQECKAFCDNADNQSACTAWAKQKGFVAKPEVKPVKEKTGPGGCKSFQECDNFCRKPENMKACMQFAVDDGKISQEEADFMVEQAQKFGPPGGEAGLQGDGAGRPGQGGPGQGGPKIDEGKAIKILNEKGGPGGCKTMGECENFCQNPDNREVCMNFAIENEMMAPQEVEKAKKTMKIDGPGGCKTQQECDAFCNKEGNGEICMKFSIDNGLMAPEEINRIKKQMEIAKKLQDKSGPGGCRGPEECGKYCSEPSHVDECMNFASKNGMMSQGEVQQRKGEMQIMQNRVMQTEERQRQFMMPPLPLNGQDVPLRGGAGGMIPPGNYVVPKIEQGQTPPQGEGRVIMPYRLMEGQGGQNGGQGEFIPRDGQPQGQPGQMMPNVPMQPREGERPPMPPQGMMPNQQFQQQGQPSGDFQQPYIRNDNFQPPAGMGEGGFQPPQQFQNQYNPNPSAPMMDQRPPQPMAPQMPQGDFVQPPPSSQPAPSSFRFQPQSLVGIILSPFLEILK